MARKILLGTNHEGEKVYLSKHTWDCGWHWSFGYLGNASLHYHFKQHLDGTTHNINKVFKKTSLSQADWWILMDLFKTAYAYQGAAEAMRYGGHMSDGAKPHRVLGDNTELNKMLEQQLDNIWNYCLDAI